MVHPEQFSDLELEGGTLSGITHRSRSSPCAGSRFDPKWIGALTLRASYSEAFRAPTVVELSPAGGEIFSQIHDPKHLTPENNVEVLIGGNPLLLPETARALNGLMERFTIRSGSKALP